MKSVLFIMKSVTLIKFERYVKLYENEIVINDRKIYYLQKDIY